MYQSDVREDSFSIDLGDRNGKVRSIMWPYLSRSGVTRFMGAMQKSDDKIALYWGKDEPAREVEEDVSDLANRLGNVKITDIIGSNTREALDTLRRRGIRSNIVPHVSIEEIDALRSN